MMSSYSPAKQDRSLSKTFANLKKGTLSGVEGLSLWLAAVLAGCAQVPQVPPPDGAREHRPAIHFPDYSQPVALNQTDLIDPHPFIPTKIKIGYFYEASSQLNRYQLIQGDPIEPRILLEPAFFAFWIAEVTIDVAIYDDQDKELLKIPVSLMEDLAGRKVFQGSVTPLASQYQDWPNEVNLSVKITLNGSHFTRLFNSFLYINPVATLAQTQPPYVTGPHLVIPVLVHGKEKGFYMLEGVLFAQETHEPLVYLTGKTQLEQAGGTAILELKAHVQALRFKGEEGPYYFRPNRLERMRNFIGDVPKEGSDQVRPPIVIPRFSFSAYSP